MKKTPVKAYVYLTMVLRDTYTFKKTLKREKRL